MPSETYKPNANTRANKSTAAPTADKVCTGQYGRRPDYWLAYDLFLTEKVRRRTICSVELFF